MRMVSGVCLTLYAPSRMGNKELREIGIGNLEIGEKDAVMLVIR